MDSRLGLLVFLILSVIIPSPVSSCTIFCAKDQHGQVWAGNNEDFYFFDFSTWIKIEPKTDSTFSCLYFGYRNSPFPQGGVNEAGLFYDGNAVEPSEIKGTENKIPFPGEGEHAIMLYVLAHCNTVPEVIELFRKYRTPWMTTCQINLADKQGNMGIITADSAWLTQGDFQISTNYNLSHNDDDYKKCWRYPIAHSMLSSSAPGFELLTRICEATRQRNGANTIYSNVHNLSTGEMWLYYASDYKAPYKTTFDDMMALGDTLILFRDLFARQTVTQAYDAFKEKGFAAGLEIINTIDDPDLREDKLELLSLNALFDFDFLVESRKPTITQDQELIRRVIRASNSEEILSRIARYNISSKNKVLVSQKMQTIKGPGTSKGLLLPGLAVAAGVIGLLLFIRKSRRILRQRQ